MAVAPFPDLETPVAARAAGSAIDAVYGNEPHVAEIGGRHEGTVDGSDTELAPQVASAHRAVEVVLHSVDRVAARDQHAVNLRFSVGGDELDVRVELHANEVRAIFRTESPELRAALSQEWNAAASGTTRSVTPVFTSNDTGNFSGFNGDAAAQQRDAHARRTREDTATAAISRARRASRSDVPAVPASMAGPISPRAASATSRHLHTLA